MDEVGGQTTSFEYDGAGRLVKEVRPDGTSTIYVVGIYEVELYVVQAVTNENSYYAVPWSAIAARTVRTDLPKAKLLADISVLSRESRYEVLHHQGS